MTEPNFSTVFVGLESPDEDVLAIANKFQNIRNPMLESVRNINKNGLTVLGSFIIGFDGERPGAGQRIASFVDIANIPVVMINKLQAAPNTKLWDRLKKEKRLCEQLGSGNSTIGKMNFLPSRPETDIDREFVALWDEVYDASNFLRRTYNYYLTMRPTRKAMAKLEGRKSAPRCFFVQIFVGSFTPAKALLAAGCGFKGTSSVLETVFRYSKKKSEPVRPVSYGLRYGRGHV